MKTRIKLFLANPFIAITIFIVFGMFVIPTLVSAKSTLAVLIAIGLIAALIAYAANIQKLIEFSWNHAAEQAKKS